MTIDKKISDSMARLYQAIDELTHVQGKANVARLLNVSPQKINNWELREVSFEGAVEVEKRFGVSPLWIKTGEGQMIAGKSRPMYFPSEEAMTIAHLYDKASTIDKVGVWLALKSVAKNDTSSEQNLSELVKHLTKL
jgi:hypothetical protein